MKQIEIKERKFSLVMAIVFLFACLLILCYDEKTPSHLDPNGLPWSLLIIPGIYYLYQRLVNKIPQFIISDLGIEDRSFSEQIIPWDQIKAV